MYQSITACYEGAVRGFVIHMKWMVFGMYMFCFFDNMEMKDITEFASVLRYAMIGCPGRVLLAWLSAFWPDWFPRVGVVLGVYLPPFVLFSCLQKVLVLCFVSFIRLQKIMDYSYWHCGTCGRSVLFLPWFWNEAGAGCALLVEVADFSLPLSFGINRIFLQFHSCTVP